MSNHALSQVRHFRASSAGVSRALEIKAVIDEITEGWDLAAVCATAARGVAEADQTAIRELIQAEELGVAPETAVRKLYDWCRTRVQDLIEEAETQDRRDEVASAYLQALGDEGRARGETYAEIADRLDDDIMRAADAWAPHRAEVLQILGEYFHDPAEYWDDEELRFRLAWETEYDEYGECINDIVEDLRPRLPPGWVAEWTGEGNGDAEDFCVQYVGED